MRAQKQWRHFRFSIFAKQKILPSSSNASTQATIELFEASGALVRSVQVNTDNATLDLSGLANGVYHVTIRTSEGSTTRQVIHQ